MYLNENRFMHSCYGAFVTYLICFRISCRLTKQSAESMRHSAFTHSQNEMRELPSKYTGRYISMVNCAEKDWVGRQIFASVVWKSPGIEKDDELRAHFNILSTSAQKISSYFLFDILLLIIFLIWTAFFLQVLAIALIIFTSRSALFNETLYQVSKDAPMHCYD